VAEKDLALSIGRPGEQNRFLCADTLLVGLKFYPLTARLPISAANQLPWMPKDGQNRAMSVRMLVRADKPVRKPPQAESTRPPTGFVAGCNRWSRSG
jgi:hypothetical protein